MPNLVTHLNWTLVFEWCGLGVAPKNKYKKDVFKRYWITFSIDDHHSKTCR